jgi:hypothetical protein
MTTQPEPDAEPAPDNPWAPPPPPPTPPPPRGAPGPPAADNPCPAHPTQPGAPTWCRPCADRITTALARIPTLAAELALRGITDEGRLAASGEAGRATRQKIAGSPSGSPAWDAADELIEWAHTTEEQLRAHLGHSAMVRVRVFASGPVRVNYLDRSVRYLREWVSALLAAPFAETVGREVLDLARRAERANGFDRLVHHLPVPCPTCDTRALTREDGSDQVECRACCRVWPEQDYRRLVLILASDYQDVAGA